MDYSTFDTITMTQSQPLPQRPCSGLGIQWMCFIVGWILWPLWTVAAVVWCCSPKWRHDPREKAGFVANCIMAVVFWVVLIAVVSRVTYSHYYAPEGYCDPYTGYCY